MIPWNLLGKTTTPGGDEMALMHQPGEFLILAGGKTLMSSRLHGSEEAMAEMACGHLRTIDSPTVLVGGLGMGFTVRATLNLLPATAHGGRGGAGRRSRGVESRTFGTPGRSSAEGPARAGRGDAGGPVAAGHEVALRRRAARRGQRPVGVHHREATAGSTPTRDWPRPSARSNGRERWRSGRRRKIGASSSASSTPGSR